MKPEIKAKWLAALRSGEYEQGKGMLRTGDNKFCCLGVLCDIHSREVGGNWTKDMWPMHRRHMYPWQYFGMDLSLPEEVAAWSGLPSASGNPHLGGYSCAAHNDGGVGCERKSFPEIADLIEAIL